MKNMKELNEGLLTEVTGGAQDTNNTESAVRSVCIEVAEKIIATEEALNAGQIVPLSLTHEADVLPETTVRIRKSSGEVLVTFNTSNYESVTILNNYTGYIRSFLMEFLKHIDYIEVSVNFG